MIGFWTCHGWAHQGPSFPWAMNSEDSNVQVGSHALPATQILILANSIANKIGSRYYVMYLLQTDALETILHLWGR